MMWRVYVLCFALLSGIEGGPVKRNAHVLRKPSPEERAGLVEGDMNIQSSQGTFRSAVKEERYRWPNGIVPYVFSDKAKETFTADQMKNVTLAMGEFHKHTCIRFVPYTNEMNYVKIVIGNGCSSNVGMMGRYYLPGQTPQPSAQTLVLGEGCFNKGTLMHEMMHGLGFYHEQSRWDRDDYVRIREEYVRQGKLRQFRIFKEDRAFKTLGAPYDYSSIMHYPPHSFAAYEDEDTIETIKPGVEIGQRRGFSDIDVWKINTLYNCPRIEGVTLPPESFIKPVKPEEMGNVEPTMPTHQSDAFYCNFDYGTSCGMRDTFDSDFDWSSRAKPTISKNTGPDADQSGDGYYIYTETTGKKPGQKAFIIMPYMQPTEQSCLKFWYNMNGETMGKFRIFTRDYLGNESEVFQLSGHQGNEWKRVVTTIVNDKPFEVVFEYEVTDILGLGDMALDEVTLFHGLPRSWNCKKYAEALP